MVEPMVDTGASGRVWSELSRGGTAALATIHGGAESAKAKAAEVARKLHNNDTCGDYPSGKAAEMKFGCANPVPDDASYVSTLRYDLVNTCYWSGSLQQDYLFFCAQVNPWLGIFLCHPNHPFGKLERSMMQIIALSISIVPAAVIARTFGPEHAVSIRLCTIVLITIPSVIVGAVLQQVAIADTRCASCPPCVAFARGCRSLLFCVAVVFGFAMSLAAYLIMMGQELAAGESVDWGEMIRPLFVGQLYSAVIWFPLNFVLPCRLGFYSMWKAEEAALQEEQAALAGAPQE